LKKEKLRWGLKSSPTVKRPRGKEKGCQPEGELGLHRLRRRRISGEKAHRIAVPINLGMILSRNVSNKKKKKRKPRSYEIKKNGARRLRRNERHTRWERDLGRVDSNHSSPTTLTKINAFIP